MINKNHEPLAVIQLLWTVAALDLVLQVLNQIIERIRHVVTPHMEPRQVFIVQTFLLSRINHEKLSTMAVTHVLWTVVELALVH